MYLDTVSLGDAVQVLQLRHVGVGQKLVSGGTRRLKRTGGLVDAYPDLRQELAQCHLACVVGPRSPLSRGVITVGVLAVANDSRRSRLRERPRRPHRGDPLAVRLVPPCPQLDPLPETNEDKLGSSGNRAGGPLGALSHIRTYFGASYLLLILDVSRLRCAG